VSELIIGIDLGTTNSEVAVVRDGRVDMIEVDGAPLLPSVVGLADDGSLLVGASARNQYVLYPERTIKSIKRSMGQNVKIAMGDREYHPQEISALILGHLKRAAESYLGEPVTRAVITVPAYFSDSQRQATRDAGELAGLEVVRIINEPTAAALAYEPEHAQRKTVLVYDLGGGTFDVSVVRVESEVVEVLASHGNNQLGGDDFDNRIREYLVNWLKRERDIDPSDDRRAMARLTRAAEEAKIKLSDAPYTQIDEEYLLEQDGKPVHLSVELSRLEYEEMIEPYVAETLDAVHIALSSADLAVKDIDEVLLVGGATRTPLIQRRLEETLGLQPRVELNPDLCVATGAAIQAAVIGGKRVSNVLLDITPYTFGTNALEERNGLWNPFTYVPLIRKNTPIPVTKSEAFETIYDGQTELDINVYQGEDPDALNNTKIGEFRFSGLGDVPAGNTIITTFALDVNGILHVSSVEKRTGKQAGITIRNATTRFEQDEMNAARERVAALLHGVGSTSDAGEAQRELVKARALVEKAEKLLGGVGSEDAEDLINGIEAVRDALVAEDLAALGHATAILSDLIFYLET